MKTMSTTEAWLWFLGGFVWFVVWASLALWSSWSSKITPPETAQKFFSKEQYNILYKAKPAFDPNHPNPKFKLEDSKNNNQAGKLDTWTLNACVAIDGTAAQPKKFLESGCFCENAPAVKAIFAPGSVIQPWNTWSTVSLGVAGMLILGFLVFSDLPSRINFMSVNYFFALCYAFMTIFLGPASMMLHVGLRKWGGWFDSLSLYVWFGFVAAYGLYRLIVAITGTEPDKCPPWTYTFFVVGWVGFVLLAAIPTNPDSPDPTKWYAESTTWYLILGGLALFGEGVLYLLNGIGWTKAPATSFDPAANSSWYSELLSFETGGRTWFLAGGITFFLALAIWVASFTEGPLCAPQSLQGHAVFHTLSAFAAAFLYKYYRHEGEVSPGW